MGFIELFILAVGLSMDAFAVSICKGLSVQRLRPRHALICGAYFGGFQALMPLIGWLLGRQFEELIKSIDHWIAFGLLVLIGANMIRESFGKDEEVNDSFSFKTMLPLAIATSIDALAVGVTFAFLEVQISNASTHQSCLTDTGRNGECKRREVALKVLATGADGLGFGQLLFQKSKVVSAGIRFLEVQCIRYVCNDIQRLRKGFAEGHSLFNEVCGCTHDNA